MKTRAIYIGPLVDESNIFLNFGMTGWAELRDEKATYKFFFYPDGRDEGLVLKESELHFNRI